MPRMKLPFKGAGPIGLALTAYDIYRRLPPKQRSAVVLRFASDMSYAGIAKALDCSQDAARRNVHEGLQKLRGEFA